ncbi:MAG: ABC transporter permease, partial [Candidatus Cloacimonetes bacterium]|nr:ABC transporter permease [Candidatus Cloacimonadota bacterium]
MLKNYLAIAIRNLVKYKFFNFINIAGLTVGITCAILIGLYLRYELSYDKYNIDYDRIYRLESHFNIHGNDDKFAVTAFPLARALQLEYPQIESYTRFLSMDNNFFKHQEKNIFEENVYFADSTVFDIFSWKFISGSAGKSLAEPNTMVLTRSLASRIFGNEDPMGEVLDTGYGFGFTITGVIEDIPGNSHLNFSALCSMITLSNFYGVDNYNSLDSRFFWNVGFFSYIKLYENSEIQDIMEDFPRFYDKYMKALGDQFNASFQLMVQPLADVHLYSKVGHDLPRGNVAYIYIFGIVAIFLLVIASINYMNLATS